MVLQAEVTWHVEAWGWRKQRSFEKPKVGCNPGAQGVRVRASACGLEPGKGPQMKWESGQGQRWGLSVQEAGGRWLGMGSAPY